MMPFRARYEGTCKNCGGKIEPGQLIQWSRRRRRPGEKRRYWHEVCPDPSSPSEFPAPVETSEETEEPSMEAHTHNDVAHNGNGRPEGGPGREVFEIMAGALAPFLDGKIAGQVEPIRELLEDLERRISSRIAELEARPPQKIEVSRPDGSTVELEARHRLFPVLLNWASRRQSVYLYGPPGSGKSTAGKMVAEALGLPFYFVSLAPSDMASKILGYQDAEGRYVPSVFFKAYCEGGVLVLDEIDNASASLQAAINTMIENGHGSFPCGMVERHPDFVLIAAGNTNGRGGNPAFPERRPFDGAFLTRFRFLEWDYDEELEERLALAHNPDARGWVEYVRRVRAYCREHVPRLHVTPRASIHGAQDLAAGGIPTDLLVDALIFQGVDAETRRKVLGACGTYKEGE